ncbi:MAG TPA: flippase [Solirubrobacterales bacterium]
MNEGPRPQPRSITHNTLFQLAMQLFGATVTAGLTIFLARVLGPDQFGILALALSVAGLLLLPSDFGVAQSASRFAAEHRDNREEVAEVVASALRIKLYLASAITIALILAAGPIASAYNEPELVWPIRAMALTLLGQNIMGLYGSVMSAIGRSAEAFRLTVLKSIVEAIATVTLVLIVAGATEASLGRAIGFLAGGVFSFVLGARVLGREALGIGIRERHSTRRIATYAGAIFIIDGAYALFQQIDTLLIGAMLTVSAAGLFQAPIRLISFLRYPAQSIANGVAPRLASRTGERTAEPFRRGLRYTIVFQAMLVAPVLVWAGPIINFLLGPAYAESADVLRALAPFVFLSGIGTLLSLGVNYLGEARRRMPIAIGTIAVNFAIDIVLIPKIGIVGAAIGTDIAFALYVAGHLWVCWRMIELPLRPLLVSAARSLLAAAVMAIPLLALGTDTVAVPLIFVGGLVSIAVYVAAIAVTREVPASEFRLVLDRVTNALKSAD